MTPEHRRPVCRDRPRGAGKTGLLDRVVVLAVLTALAAPGPAAAQEAAGSPRPETVPTPTVYAGAVGGIGNRIAGNLRLYVVGAQLALQRERAEWVVIEPFALWTTEGPGFLGGIQTAWTVSLVEGGPYLGAGAGVWSPTHGLQGFACGRAGIHPMPGRSGLRVELQVHDRIVGDAPNRMAILLLGFQFGQ